jgi:hypothetical protein
MYLHRPTLNLIVVFTLITACFAFGQNQSTPAIKGWKRGTGWGYSLYEFGVYRR